MLILAKQNLYSRIDYEEFPVFLRYSKQFQAILGIPSYSQKFLGILKVSFISLGIHRNS